VAVSETMLPRCQTDLPAGLRLLVVEGLDDARGFYEGVLELPVLRDSGRGLVLGAGTPPVPVIALCPGDSLRLDGSRRLIHALLAAQGGSWVQVVTADLDAMIGRLAARGAPILQPALVRADGSRAGAALDPWDNTVRLVAGAADDTR